jgi:drug/metabolite transporter (DMT)-like permease
MNEKAKGYFLGAIAASTYGMNPLFALPLYDDGMSPNSVLFFRYLLAIPIVGLMIKSRGRSFSIEKKNIAPLLLFGVFLSISSLTLFYSYKHMDAGIAATLLFVYPVVVALIMYFIFKERLSRQTIFCVLLVLIGIGLLYKGEAEGTLSLTGTLLVVISAISYAIYIVGVNHGNIKEMATIKVSFYVLIFGWMVIATSTFANDGLQIPSQLSSWLNLLMLAILPTTVSLVCTTAAIKYIGSTPTAILGALEPVTAIFIGITVFNEIISPREWLGLIIIIVAVTLVIAGNSVTSHLIRFRKLFPKIRRK